MYCPECGTEYRPGFTECADCHVPLADEPPGKPADPGLEVRVVFEASDPFVVASAKSLLEEAGIAYYVIGEELAIRLGPIGPFIQPLCRIQVASDREQEARGLLEQLG